MLFAAETVVILIAVYTGDEMANFLRHVYIYSVFPLKSISHLFSYVLHLALYIYTLFPETCTFHMLKKYTSHWVLFRFCFWLPCLYVVRFAFALSAGQRACTLFLTYTVRPDQPLMISFTVFSKHLVYTPGPLHSIHLYPISFVLI